MIWNWPPVLAAEATRWPWVLVTWCVLIAAASAAGGMAPVLLRLSHRGLQLIISGVAGLMLGVGVFHMLPHAVVEVGSVDQAVLWMMLGILVMFFLLRAFHFHQHGGPAESDHAAVHATCPHEHDHDHDHGRPHAHAAGAKSSHPFSWLGIAFGLTIHTLIDGVALASMVQVDAREGRGWLLGVPAFLAIVLHKPLDAASIASLMMAGGWAPSSRQMINLAFAVMVPVGAFAFVAIGGGFDARQHLIVGCSLAFSAGVFVCIALADLLPEIEFHSHDRVLLSILLLLGVAVAYAIGLIEPGHLHTH